MPELAAGGHVRLGQPVLHEGVAGDARRSPARRRGRPPDPRVEPRAGGPAHRDHRRRPRLVGLKASDFDQKAWDASAGRTASTTPSRSTPTRSSCTTTRTSARRPACSTRNGKLKPITGTDGWEAALAGGQEGHRGATAPRSPPSVTPRPAGAGSRASTPSSNGATPWLGDGGKQLTYNEDLTMKTLSYMQSLTKSGLMPANTDYAGAADADVHRASRPSTSRASGRSPRPQAVKGLKFGMVAGADAVRQRRRRRPTRTRSSCRARRTGPPTQLQRAMGFVKSMLDQSMTWAQGGHIPAYLPTAEQPGVQGAASPSRTTPPRPSAVHVRRRRPGTRAPARTSRTPSARRSGWCSRACPRRQAALAAMKDQLGTTRRPRARSEHRIAAEERFDPREPGGPPMSAIATQRPGAPAAPTTRPSSTSDTRRPGRRRPAWLFIAPFGIFFLLFLVWPVIYMIITSFFNTSTRQPGFGSFAGFGNYAEMLGQPRFWSSLWHTIHFTIYTTPPLVILAFVLADPRQPRAARAVVLPAGLLRPVRAAVRSDLADLGLHLHPRPQACGTRWRAPSVSRSRRRCSAHPTWR